MAILNMEQATKKAFLSYTDGPKKDYFVENVTFSTEWVGYCPVIEEILKVVRGNRNNSFREYFKKTEGGEKIVAVVTVTMDSGEEEKVNFSFSKEGRQRKFYFYKNKIKNKIATNRAIRESKKDKSRDISYMGKRNEDIIMKKMEDRIEEDSFLTRRFKESLSHYNFKTRYEIFTFLRKGEYRNIINYMQGWKLFTRNDLSFAKKTFKEEFLEVSKQIPKIMDVLWTFGMDGSSIAELLNIKVLRHALTLTSNNKLEAALLAVFVGEQLMNIKNVEEIMIPLQILKEIWVKGDLDSYNSEEVEKATKIRKMIWKFRHSSEEFLFSLLTNIERKEIKEEMKKEELEKTIYSFQFISEFKKYQGIYEIPELEELTTTIPLIETKKEGLRAWVLDPKDPMQVALGADYLGGITCCQCIDGAGEECVAEGLSNEKSGFLGIQDEKGLVAQAWLWESVDGKTLVLDNIELNKGRAVSCENIEEILRAWCDALPYKGIQLGLGYTELKIGKKTKEKEFAAAPFDIWDIYSDARHNRNWLKREGKVCI